MKHDRLPFAEFLGLLRGDSSLHPEERRQIEGILQAREEDAEALVPKLLALVRGLLARGYWELVEGSLAPNSEAVVLRDTARRIRYRLRLAPPAVRAPDRLPIPGVDESALPARVTRAVLASPSELVSYDRILSPREIIANMERFLSEVVPAHTVRFHPFELGGEPHDAQGSSVDPARTLPIDSTAALELARRRDHVYRWTKATHGRARLILAIGDDSLGWKGALELESETDWDAERLVSTVWIAQHYAEILSTVMRLEGLIFYDFLTGVYNRSFYEDQMDRELQLARRRQEPMALLLVDIDDFKAFNTRHGYEGGDRVLATVACVLKGALRGTDTLARYGGEEFVVILAPPVSAEEAARIADRLRQAVELEELPLSELDGSEYLARVTVSIGGALYPQHGETRDALWTASNLRLLRAKREGKNRVIFDA